MEPTKRKIQQANASAHPDSPTITEYAQNAHQELFGVQHLANASMFAGKTQPTQLQPTPVFAVLDLVFLVGHVKHAHQDILSLMDIVLLAQSTQLTTLPPKIAHVFLDFSPTNGVFVLENVVLTKFITLPLKLAHVLMGLQESMELVRSALQDLPQPLMDLPAQLAKLMRYWSMDNANAIKAMHTTLLKSALSALVFQMDF